MPYADYSYYTDVYLGTTIDENVFNVLAARATRYLNYVTDSKITVITEQVKNAMCAVAEVYNLDSILPMGIKSESNDGVSVAYEWSLEKALLKAARENLAGTGLLYRGL